VQEWLERSNLTNCGQQVKLVVSSGPNPWLISKTALSESSPCIPPVLVVVGIVILIREIAHEKQRLAIALQVMLQSGSRVVCLSQVPDEAKRVGSVKTMRGRGNEPKLAGVFTGSNLVIVFLVVL